MMSAWWLLLIVPASLALGFVACLLLLSAVYGILHDDWAEQNRPFWRD